MLHTKPQTLFKRFDKHLEAYFTEGPYSSEPSWMVFKHAREARTMPPVSLLTRMGNITIPKMPRIFGPIRCPNLRRVCLYGMLSLGIVLAGYTCYKYYQYRRSRDPIGNTWRSWYISVLKGRTNQPVIPSNVVRTTFCNTLKIKPAAVRNHTHPDSAALRNASVTQITYTAAVLGKPTYFVQQSTNDQKNHRDGCRTYYWGKDLNSSYAAFAARSDHLIAIVDVDMYIDMPKMLADYPNTYILSTFQPTTVSSDTGDFCFTFNAKDEVTYMVSGGASFSHQVWNYSVDTIVAVSRGFLGTSYRITAYNVDRRQIDDHHQLILLTPMATLVSPLFNISSWLGKSELKRLSVVRGKFLRLDTMTKEGLSRSTGHVGKHANVTITASQDDIVSTLAGLHKTALSVAQVKQVIGSTEMCAAILADYHRNPTADPNDCIHPVSSSVQAYQFEPRNYDPDAKPSVVPFMTPLINECYSPDQCAANDRRAVQGRVLDVRSEELEISAFMANVIHEFVTMFVPDNIAHLAHPLDYEAVYAKQNRPMQRLQLDNASLATTDIDESAISTFVKKETYTDTKDPRMISTVPPTNKLKYSTFIYAFSDHMRTMKWYAFGRTPLEISDRVCEIATNAKSNVINSDFSRFDGHVSNVLRDVESMVILRFFDMQYHGELTALVQSQQNRRAYTTFDVAYETHLARLSGSPETADFNSVDNAFVAYLAKRMTKVRGNYLTSQEAWDQLGIYGGDDGLTSDMDGPTYIKAAKMVGQVLEVEEIKRGDSGVSFLSRQFSPQVWFGDPDNCCDIRRQLGKFHVTSKLPPDITPYDKLGEKLAGLLHTDRNTPVFSDLVNLMATYYPDILPGEEKRQSLAGVRSWFGHAEASGQFPNENKGGWMDEYFTTTHPSFDLGLFKTWIESCKTDKTKLLTPPLCEPASTTVTKTKHDVVVNGEVYAAEPSAPAASLVMASSSPPTNEQYKASKAVQAASSNNPPNAEAEPKKPLCNMYRTPNGCTFRNCKFAHVDCNQFSAGNCKRGDACQFRHGPPAKSSNATAPSQSQTVAKARKKN